MKLGLWVLVSCLVSGVIAEEERCIDIAQEQLGFCSMVQYSVRKKTLGEALEADKSVAKEYNALEKVLAAFDCRTRYSLHSCDDCREAYKYWLCSIRFPHCDAHVVSSKECDAGCGEANDCCLPNSHQTCLSICEDAVRKCPYTVNFACPKKPTQDYSTNSETCNKLNRTRHPYKPSLPWPGTFA